MNWTGGRLQRHSTANRNAVARQKQHFAKAQQNLRGGPKKQSPTKFSIFDHVVEDRERYRRGTSPAESAVSHHRDRSQSLRSRHGSLLPVADFLQKRENSTFSRNRKREHSPAPMPRQKSQVVLPGEDLYNAKSPPQPARFEREASLALPGMGFEACEVEEQSMAEKRLRLLRKRDWVGVGIQKPVRIKLAASAVDDNIGKRRKVKDGHRARFQSKQTHILSPFAEKRRRLLRPARGEPHHREPRADVRISIGGKSVLPGVSSSSMGRSRSRSVAARQRSYTASTEVMLLDEVDQAETQTNRIFHIKLTPGSQSHPHIPSRQSRKDRFKQINSAPSIPETIYSSTHNSRISIRSSEFKHPVPHRPIPRGSKLSALMSSSPPDIADSTIVHVGILKPVVSSSQLLANEIWATWVAPASDDGEMLLHEAEKEPYVDGRRVSISPGVSAALATWEAADEIIEDPLSFELESPDVEEDSQKMGSEDAGPHNTVNSETEGQEEQKGEDFPDVSVREQPEMCQEDLARTKPSTPFDHFRSIAAEGTKIALKRDAEVDEGEIWRKFVFGGSSEGMIEDGFEADDVVSMSGWRPSQVNSLISAITCTERLVGSPGYCKINQPVMTTSQESPQTSKMSDNIARVTDFVSLKSKHLSPPAGFQIEEDGRTSLHTSHGSATENRSLSPLARWSLKQSLFSPSLQTNEEPVIYPALKEGTFSRNRKLQWDEN